MSFILLFRERERERYIVEKEGEKEREALLGEERGWVGDSVSDITVNHSIITILHTDKIIRKARRWWKLYGINVNLQ